MSLPLLKKTIVVTRDNKQAQNFKRKIEELGGSVIEFPVIKIIETENWIECDKAIVHLKEYDWIVFTSINAAHYFILRLQRKNIKIDKQKIAVIGQKIADYLKENSIITDLIPEKFNAKELLKSFNELSLDGSHVLLPVSNLAGDVLKNGLEKQGCVVNKVEVYRTIANYSLNTEEMLSLIKSGSVHCLTFFSPSAFKYFIETLNNDVMMLLKKQKPVIAAIGDTTAGVIIKSGLQVEIKPVQSSEECMLDEIVKYFKKIPVKT